MTIYSRSVKRWRIVISTSVARWPKMPARPQVKARAGRSPAAPRQGARSDLQQGQWVVRWLVIQDVAQWLEQPVVRRQGSCADSFVARLRAMAISSLFSAVLRSEATIRWAGSNRTVWWRCCHFLAVDGQEGPDEASCDIADYVSGRGVGAARYLASSSLMAWRSLLRSKGFSKTRRAPKSFATSRKFLSPWAPVMAITFASIYSRVNCKVASRPSVPGMRMSMRTRSTLFC